METMTKVLDVTYLSPREEARQFMDMSFQLGYV